MRIGIDIGGTNTDAVMIDDQNRIVKTVKVPTTLSIEEGVAKALAFIPSDDVSRICIGTTHALNAILQGTGLYRVGVIRISPYKQEILSSCVGWPEYLRDLIHVATVTVDGGYECDGRITNSFDPRQILQAVKVLKDMGAESIAIIGTFSPMHADQEEEAAALIEGMPVSTSHSIGGIGFIERENSTILDAALKKVMKTGFEKLAQEVLRLGFNCPVYISRNNGSIMTLDQALEHPVLTLSSGPTNSFIGAGRLSGIKNAVIVDIGGTSTDVGIIKNGYPRRCLQNSHIGGVALNFPTPDVLSVALGGGSIIEGLTIGPKSCAKELFNRGLSFGGDLLTLTDVALALNQISIDSTETIDLDPDYCHEVMKLGMDMIERLIDRIELQDSNIPIVIVGGGAALIPKTMLTSRYFIPKNANVANAFGAASGEASASVDRIVCLDQREKVLAELRLEVLERCGQGSSIVDVQIIPYHYMPGNKARIVMMAAII